MALLLSFLPHSLLSPPICPRSCSCSCSLSSPLTNGRSGKTRGGSAILWFKHDLRVDDHPGLVVASKYPALLPLYVFDHRILSRYSDDTLELVLFALQDLRSSLKQQGSNLMVRFGSAENVIRALALQVQAAGVFAEEEVEYQLRQLMDVVEQRLVPAPSLDGNPPEFVQWRTPFYAIQSVKDLPASHADFMKLQVPVTSPVQPPTLPRVPMELEWGSLPTFEVLKKFTNENPFKLKEWMLIKEMPGGTILQKRISKLRETRLSNLDFKDAQRKRPGESVFVTQKRDVVGGGTKSVLNALAAYLRYLEGTARDDWQEVHERLRIAESRDGASFAALFGPSLYLGIISKRRVYYEAIKYEKERNAGFLSPFGYSTATVAAAADAVCSMEWYWLMALESQRSEEGTRIWRWKGYLIQYAAVGHEGPAVLLVHGFGAFLEHYRDNIHGICKGGNRVWALTVLGFGRSEKPNLVYTELVWAELLRDFIVEVVCEPVHLVGNSIGGYFAALVACCWPTLVKSVVLVNSAGDIIPRYSYLQFPKDRQTSRAAWLGARLLLFYLRFNIRNLVKNCYPTGMKDPIADSKSKVAMLKEHCSGVVIRELDAGHCPHDEQPEQANFIICEWVAAVESKLLAGSFS